jgi:hypothetical protein
MPKEFTHRLQEDRNVPTSVAGKTDNQICAIAADGMLSSPP